MTGNLNIKKRDVENPETIEFILNWEDDIEEIFPHFTEEDLDFSSVYSLHDEEKEIGVFIYQRKGEELHVHVDYVISEYRDMGIGEDFFKQKIQEFKNLGFATIVALTNNDIHIKYLNRLNFGLSNKHPHRYELELV